LPFELFVALRYLRDGRVQTGLILTAIGVGVGVIIFLSALITGLQASLIERTLGSQALVIVRPPEEMPRTIVTGSEGTISVFDIERPPQRVRSIDEWQTTADLIRNLPGVTAVAPTVVGPAIAIRGLGSAAVSVRGIDPERYRDIVNLDERLVSGTLDFTGFQAVIGTGLAANLGLAVGGRLRLQAAGDRGGVYTLTGIFDYGSTDLNERLVFLSLASAQSLFDIPGGVSTLEIRNTDIFAAATLAAAIEDRTGLDAESWIARNEDLLLGLRSQSLSSVMIQVFVIIAVALGIASVLSVSVAQRAPEIGILRATGTRASAVTRIFLLQGAILGIAGSALGIALGSVLALLFQEVAQGPNGFPVSLTLELYLRSAGIALVVGTLAALIPARKAAGMDPATVIRDG